ncbi:hypothetical protein BCR32DRAFT_296922 [Anaeromyces robustus]|uniref:Ankyrin repeat domain-containing protein n=1 Tax=Anaeromyces robustus TaxID=1754192 RepID=A0A1Y1WPU6_9FUNG|nr:hypothetical protein BCR32DRAFT_296922 [Anaeromyces robustus]|eukprot:ORX75405.1 hypothetical protein BCR32DRAFT_296922 [Anaeromyces robustus]
MENYRLHKLIFLKDLNGLKAELGDYTPENPCPEINQLDLHGQTPLTLAITTGFNEAVQLLIDNGASVLTKNSAGWNPFQEATSYGNRQVMAELIRRQKDELVQWFNEKGQRACKAFSNSLEDFYIEMNWKFDSWVPLLNKLCPSDKYRIWKKGTSLRIDTTLVGFENLKWIIGDISVIFYVDEKTDEPSLYIVDRKNKIYQRVFPRSEIPTTDEALAETISINMKTPIVSNPSLPIEKLKLTRAQTGWWNKEDKYEKIGKYYTSVWNLSNVEINTLTRNEHVTAIKKYEKEKEEAEKRKNLEIRKQEIEQRTKRLQKKLSDSTLRALKDSTIKLSSPTKTEPTEGEKTEEGEEAEKKIEEEKKEGNVEGEGEGEGEKKEEEEEKKEREKEKEEEGSDSKTHEVKSLDDSIKNLEEGKNIKNPNDKDVENYVNSVKDTWDAFQSYVDLPPPPPSDIQFEDYFFLKEPGYLHLGRKQEIEESKLKFKAVLWVSSQESCIRDPDFINGTIPLPERPFPMKIEQLYPVLDILGFGSNNHINTLRDVLNATLPDGFPVQIEIPVFNVFSALISFDNYNTEFEIGEDHFKVPFDEFEPGIIISKLSDDEAEVKTETK